MNSDNHEKIADAGEQLANIFILGIAASHSVFGGDRVLIVDLVARAVVEGYRSRCQHSQSWTSTHHNTVVASLLRILYYTLPAKGLCEALKAWPKRHLLNRMQWINIFGRVACIPGVLADHAGYGLGVRHHIENLGKAGTP